MGAARSRRYGLLKAVRDLGPEVPVYRVDEGGNAAKIGTLCSLAGGEFWFESCTGDRAATRLYPDLPWWIQDLRPQGFLGRLLPRTFPELNLPLDIRLWDGPTVLYALSRRGDYLLGDLILGDVAYARWWEDHRAPLEAFSAEGRPSAYSKIVKQVMEGRDPGSSAGGEQPKFLVRTRSGDQRVVDAIIKFSPPMSELAGQRWADLLLAEHHALNVLQQSGISASSSEVLVSENRVFLQVERFDRVGESGRRGVVSIGTADAEFVGIGTHWPSIARALAQQRRLSQLDSEAVEKITAFGHLIANTDMHNGNLGLLHNTTARRGYGQFELAPVYDMLPMRYAPVASEVLTLDFRVPAPVDGLIDAYAVMREPAVTLWQTVAADPRISAGFRRIAEANAKLVAGL